MLLVESSRMATERDYVLGTHDEEISRRIATSGLACGRWIAGSEPNHVGSRVLDGAAGYAAVDWLKSWPDGQNRRLELSTRARVAGEVPRPRPRQRQIYALDLMTDSLPEGS
jgi:hypothetical protein